ncbi:DUF2304 domain-containing protein [Lacunimicrobium album]
MTSTLLAALLNTDLFRMNAETMMLIGSAIAFLTTLRWVRSREMREKYAVMWLLVGGLLLFCGLFPQVIMRFADQAQLSYPSAVLFIALAIIYLFSLSVSLSLSRQHRISTRLLQEIAILKYDLEQLRAASTPPASHESANEHA